MLAMHVFLLVMGLGVAVVDGIFGSCQAPLNLPHLHLATASSSQQAPISTSIKIGNPNDFVRWTALQRPQLRGGGGVVDLTGNGGVYKEILTEGHEDVQSQMNIDVSVHYTDPLESGTKFNTSLCRHSPVSFKLGKEKVCRGWDMGVATMKSGEKARFIIRSDYAYGAEGFGDAIPGNATLIFEVELLRKTKCEIVSDGGSYVEVSYKGYCEGSTQPFCESKAPELVKLGSPVSPPALGAEPWLVAIGNLEDALKNMKDLLTLEPKGAAARPQAALVKSKQKVQDSTDNTKSVYVPQAWLANENFAYLIENSCCRKRRDEELSEISARLRDLGYIDDNEKLVRDYLCNAMKDLFDKNGEVYITEQELRSMFEGRLRALLKNQSPDFLLQGNEERKGMTVIEVHLGCRPKESHQKRYGRLASVLRFKMVTARKLTSQFRDIFSQNDIDFLARNLQVFMAHYDYWISCCKLHTVLRKQAEKSPQENNNDAITTMITVASGADTAEDKTEFEAAVHKFLQAFYAPVGLDQSVSEEEGGEEE